MHAYVHVLVCVCVHMSVCIICVHVRVCGGGAVCVCVRAHVCIHACASVTMYVCS